MATLKSKAIRSSDSQLSDQQFVVARPGDGCLAIADSDQTIARWEAEMTGPIYLVIGRKAHRQQVERLSKRWSIPVEQLISAAMVLA